MRSERPWFVSNRSIDIGSNERCESEPLTELGPHDSEYWFLRHNSNTAAHLHVNDDGDRPESY